MAASRVAVVIVAVGLLAFGIGARHSTEHCLDEGAVFFRVAAGQQARLSAQQASDFAGACRGSHLLALAASFLAAHDQPALGLRLARTATHREPDNFESWLALSRALRAARLNASADRAQRRAAALNPRLGHTPARPG